MSVASSRPTGIAIRKPVSTHCSVTSRWGQYSPKSTIIERKISEGMGRNQAGISLTRQAISQIANISRNVTTGATILVTFFLTFMVLHLT